MDSTTTTASAKPALSESTQRILQTSGYYTAFIALGLSSASLGPTLPGLADHTRSRLNEISFLFMARSLGYLIGSLLGGRLYDRVPGHPVMTVVLVVMAAMLALTPVLPLLWLLTAALLILGLGEGVLDVGGNTLLVWAHRDKVAPFMNGLHFFFGVGALLSPIIIAQKVLVSGDINWAYWTLAALVLPVAVLLLRLPVPTVLKVSKDSPQAKVNYLLIVLIAIFFFLHVGAEASMGGWIFTYATALNLTSKTMAAYLTSTFWGALTLGRLLAIPVSTRFRPRYVLLADLVGCLVSVGVILLSKSLVGVWLGTCGAGLCIASIFPTTISFAERRMTITGQVTGWFFVGSSLGGMFLPWLIGQLFESIGPRVTMLAILSDLMLALGVFAVLILYSARSVKSRE